MVKVEKKFVFFPNFAKIRFIFSQNCLQKYMKFKKNVHGKKKQMLLLPKNKLSTIQFKTAGTELWDMTIFVNRFLRKYWWKKSKRFVNRDVSEI
jgi:hypothetical protein